MELSEIKGIGEKRLTALNRMGIYTPSDLLLRFPDKYISRNAVIDRTVREGDEVSFSAVVETPAKRAFIRRGLSVVSCTVKNNGISVRCSWFNQPFAARSLQPGDSVYVVGKVKRFKSAVQMTNPTFVMPQDGDGDIVPVYKTAIPSRTFQSAVVTALANVRVNSYIPPELALKFGLMPLQQALRCVHTPKNTEELCAARQSVAVENMCYVITSYRLLKDDNRDFIYSATDGDVEKFSESLSFKPTDGQRRAMCGVIDALRGDKLTNLLIQGEVGCEIGRASCRERVFSTV